MSTENITQELENEFQRTHAGFSADGPTQIYLYMTRGGVLDVPVREALGLAMNDRNAPAGAYWDPLLRAELWRQVAEIVQRGPSK